MTALDRYVAVQPLQELRLLEIVSPVLSESLQKELLRIVMFGECTRRAGNIHEFPDERGLGEERRDDDLAHFGLVRHLVQYRGNHLFENASEAARARLVLESDFSDLLEHFGLDRQLDTFVPKDVPELLVDGILRFAHDPHQHLLGEILETGDDRKPPGEFGDQSEGKKVGRLDARIEPLQHLLALAFLNRDIPVCIGLSHDVVDPDAGLLGRGDPVEVGVQEERDAALEGARLRLRPILMTSFAFILGCVPLWTASGAGSVARQIMGTAVIGGMLAASALGIFFIPAVFYVVERLSMGKAGRAAMLTGIPAPGTSSAAGDD